MIAFRCEPLACLLTVERCVQRRDAALAAPRMGQSPLISSACRSCSVGAAHARGEEPETWSTGAQVVRRELVASGGPPQAAPPAPRAKSPARPRSSKPPALVLAPASAAPVARERSPRKAPSGGRTIEWRGERLTIAQWSARLGLPGKTIRERLRLHPDAGPERWLAPAMPPAQRGALNLGKDREPPAEALRVEWGGRALTPRQWSKVPEVAALELSPQCIGQRVTRCGWTPEEALTTPKGVLPPRIAGRVDEHRAEARRKGWLTRRGVRPSPVDVLARAGWAAEDRGEVPGGRLLLVRST